MRKLSIASSTVVLVLVTLLGIAFTAPFPTSAQSNPTPTRTRQARPTATPTREVLVLSPTVTPIAPDEDANTEYFADFLVLRYDPKSKTLYIEPVDPSIKIVIPNQTIYGAAAPALSPTPTPSPTPLNSAALRGKIIFKSTRDGGSYPDEYLYYIMNPDGSDAQRLGTLQARAVLSVLQGLEGFSPDRTKVVIGGSGVRQLL